MKNILEKIFNFFEIHLACAIYILMLSAVTDYLVSLRLGHLVDHVFERRTMLGDAIAIVRHGEGPPIVVPRLGNSGCRPAHYAPTN